MIGPVHCLRPTRSYPRLNEVQRRRADVLLSLARDLLPYRAAKFSLKAAWAIRLREALDQQGGTGATTGDCYCPGCRNVIAPRICPTA